MNILLKRSLGTGFTLIELLVIIALIGILAAVVFVAIGGTRVQGVDAGIKANVVAIQTQAEVFYNGAGDETYYLNGDNSFGSGAISNNSCYSARPNSVFKDPVIVRAIAAIRDLNKDPSDATAVNCNNDGAEWAFSARLTKDSNIYWCVDSTGAGKEIEGQLSPVGRRTCP